MFSFLFLLFLPLFLALKKKQKTEYGKFDFQCKRNGTEDRFSESLNHGRITL